MLGHPCHPYNIILPCLSDNRLPFGVASAPAIFQKLMDSVLEGIPHVICYIDDILVTGTRDQDHFTTVFKRLQKHGF